MAVTLAKLALYTVLSTGATTGLVNEVVQEPTKTLDAVVERLDRTPLYRTETEENARTTCYHVRIQIEGQEGFPLLHISHPLKEGSPYKVGEKITIPLEVSGFSFTTIGYSGKAYYAPEEYITRHEG